MPDYTSVVRMTSTQKYNLVVELSFREKKNGKPNNLYLASKCTEDKASKHTRSVVYYSVITILAVIQLAFVQQ